MQACSEAAICVDGMSWHPIQHGLSERIDALVLLLVAWKSGQAFHRMEFANGQARYRFHSELSLDTADVKFA